LNGKDYKNYYGGEEYPDFIFIGDAVVVEN
jgi:hypothetical protein